MLYSSFALDLRYKFAPLTEGCAGTNWLNQFEFAQHRIHTWSWIQRTQLHPRRTRRTKKKTPTRSQLKRTLSQSPAPHAHHQGQHASGRQKPTLVRSSGRVPFNPLDFASTASVGAQYGHWHGGFLLLNIWFIDIIYRSSFYSKTLSKVPPFQRRSYMCLLGCPPYSLSEQPTLIWEVAPYTVCVGRNYFGNRNNFQNNFSPYKMYAGRNLINALI